MQTNATPESGGNPPPLECNDSTANELRMTLAAPGSAGDYGQADLNRSRIARIIAIQLRSLAAMLENFDLDNRPEKELPEDILEHYKNRL